MALKSIPSSRNIRIKIFTERGKDRHGKVDIASAGRTKITDIVGRTIKPDGTIVELEKNAVFDRVLVQAEGIKVRAKSFAMPGVELRLSPVFPPAQSAAGRTSR